MIRSIDISGFKFYADDAFITHRWFLDHGVEYESHVRKELEKTIPSASVFWDIGSNCGIHTINAKAINPNVTVFCFEPSGTNQQLLIRNILA